MMVIVTTVLTVLKNAIECRCRYSIIVEIIDGIRPIRIGWSVYRGNHKRIIISVSCTSIESSLSPSTLCDILMWISMWFSYFERNIFIELLIIMDTFWMFFGAWSKWKFFCYKIYFERPRYVLSSTTIVITTSPSSTRALRPLVPLHWLRKQRGNLIPLERKRRSYTTAETIICLLMLKRKIRKLLLYVSFSSIILRNQRNNQESIWSNVIIICRWHFIIRYSTGNRSEWSTIGDIW